MHCRVVEEIIYLKSVSTGKTMLSPHYFKLNNSLTHDHTDMARIPNKRAEAFKPLMNYTTLKQ